MAFLSLVDVEIKEI